MKKKNYFVSLSLFSLITMLISCAGNTKNSPLSIDNILSEPETYTGKEIVVEGICTHVCSKSGMKMFLKNDANGQTIRAESNSILGKFNQELIDQNIRLKGKLVEERITESDLQEMENEIAENSKVSHGEGGEGCENEQIAENVPVGSSEMERINNFRNRIEERKASEGKDYLSFYHIATDSYHIVKK